MQLGFLVCKCVCASSSVPKTVVSSTHFPHRAQRPLYIRGSSLRTSFPQTKSIQVQLEEAIQGSNSLTVNLSDPSNTCCLLFTGKEGRVRRGGVSKSEGEREKEKKTLTRILSKNGNDESNECSGTMKQTRTASLITNRIIHDSFFLLGKVIFVKSSKNTGLCRIMNQLKLKLTINTYLHDA